MNAFMFTPHFVKLSAEIREWCC